MKAIGNMQQVRMQLMLRGYRSVEEWAQRKGHISASVRRAVYDWGQREDREPHGGITRQIMADLRKTLAEEPVMLEVA